MLNCLEGFATETQTKQYQKIITIHLRKNRSVIPWTLVIRFLTCQNICLSFHGSLRVSARCATTTRIFLIRNHQPLFHICFTSPVESAPIIPSTSFCSLSSWFTSSCAYHLITVTTFALIISRSLDFSLQT